MAVRNLKRVCLLAALLLGVLPAGRILASVESEHRADDDPALAYRPIASAAPQPSPAHGPTDVTDLEAFLDGYMASRMKPGKIAGASIAVVKDGALFFTKGYGYADFDRRVPVDPRQTLFRIASISKLFTWTAVLQLVEQGRLDLDRDVNSYLEDVRIPATYAQPITLRNLMTHSSGLDDTVYFYPDAGKHDVPMGRWLAAHVPRRIRPPTTDFADGTGTAYSNWGATLAGHIVATVAGMPFDDYVERHILQPLGMAHTSSREPLPPALAEWMSGGYTVVPGGFTRSEFELVKPMTPAGAISATATDMGRFMLAFLNQGSLPGGAAPAAGGAGDHDAADAGIASSGVVNAATATGRILAPRTVRTMLARTLSPDPAVNGTALGFYENYIDGRRVIGHGGDTRYFHSTLSLIPEAGVGFFMAVNTGGDASWAAEEVMRAFVQHYFPARLPEVKPPVDAVQRNQRYVGLYRTQGHTYGTYEKIFSGFDDLRVESLPDGTLLFADPLEGSMAHWVEVGDGVFRTERDDVFVAFKGEPGQPAGHIVGPWSPTATERVYWYDTLQFHFLLLGLAVSCFLTLGISAWRQRRADRLSPGMLRWARPVLLLAGVLLVGSVLGLVMYFASMTSAALLKGALTLALLATVPLAAAVYCAVHVWRSGAWTLPARWHYSVTLLAAVAVLGVLHYWNLLGYRFG